MPKKKKTLTSCDIKHKDTVDITSLNQIYDYNSYLSACGPGIYSNPYTGYGYGSASATSITTSTGSIPANSTQAISASLGSNTYNIGSIINTFNDDFNDITITRGKNKNSYKVAATLDIICDSLGIIIPDQKKLNENPSLKLAYDNYQEVLKKTWMTNELSEAYNNYKIIEKLTAYEDEETS